MKSIDPRLSRRVFLPAAVLTIATVISSSLPPLEAANYRDIPITFTFDDVHREVSSGTGTARVESGYGFTQVGGDPTHDYPDGGKVDTNVGRNRNIWLYGNTSNKSASGRTLWLDLSNPVGCLGSVSVDVDDVVGCDPCSDTAPPLPNQRFGAFQAPGHPDEFRGLPDNFELRISGEDHDDLFENTTVSVNARLRFTIGSDEWTLYWGPYRHPGGRTANPESDPILVRRVVVNGKDTWQIQTSGNHRATLYSSHDSPGGFGGYHGQFTIAFSAVAEAIENRAVDQGHDDPMMTPGDPECISCTDADGDGWTDCDGDCDDSDGAVFPGAPELCDLVDNDCDGIVDEDCIPCTDSDGDGYSSCDGDCDDLDPFVNPGAPEICDDGIDNDCDGVIDEDCGEPCPDADGDGWTTCAGDCDDSNPQVNPGRNERGRRASDGLDNDCNGVIDG